jgi:hypothetical protein
MRAGVGALNAFGRGLSRLGSSPPRLDQDALHRAAERRTGLSEVGWDIESPLLRLLRAYRDEARLTLLGRITAREMIVSQLANLMHLQEELSAQPKIAEEKITRPVFVTGLPRTGTTLLHNLLSQDPGNRTPLTWEAMFSAGYPNSPEAIDAVRRKTAERLGWANRLAPEFMHIHAMEPDLPQECIAITAQVFMSIQFHTTHDVASYEDWFEQDSQQLAYEFHHRLLQHLQFRRASERWMLKAPGHLFGLDALLKRYPDARIIQTHRDPLRVLASMASHATVLRRAFSDAADPLKIAADWTQRWAGALERFLATRDDAPNGQFLDIDYERLERAPMETVEEIYRFLGASLGDRARRNMQAFLDANPKHKHGVHRYSLEEFGLDRRRELSRFRDYCDRFGIEIVS